MPGVVVVRQVDRIGGVVVWVSDQRTAAESRVEPVDLQVVDLQTGIFTVAML